VSCSLLYGSCTLRHVGPLASLAPAAALGEGLPAAGAAVALMEGMARGLGVARADASGRCAAGL
jgi:hypothetical protein